MLAPGGAFVIEAFVPDPADFDRDEQVQVRSVTEDSVTIRLHRYDRAAQRFIRQTITFDDGGVHLKPFAHAVPLAGADRRDGRRGRAAARGRYADWRREPFGPDSRDHISVYRKT